MTATDFQPRTCRDESEHGIYLRGAPSRTITLSLADLATVLAHEDGLAEGLRKLLVDKGVAVPHPLRGCPMAIATLQSEDYAPDSDRCATCGSPTRELDREELRP